MNSIILNLKNSTKYLAIPFTMLSILSLIGGVIQILPAYNSTEISTVWSDYFDLIAGVLSNGFITYYVCKNSKKAFSAITVYLVFDLAYYGFSGYHFGILFSILIAFASAKIHKECSLIYGFLITLISGLIVSFGLGLLHPYILEMQKSICTFFSGRGSLFGGINDFYTIAFGNDLSDLFYKNDYSGRMLIDNNIIAGAINIFEASKDTPLDNTSEYLCGKYFATIFLPIGAYICIFPKLEKQESNALTLCAISSIIFGSSSLFSAFIFLFNPFVYLGYMVTVFIGYYVASLLNIRIGYTNNSSIIELAKHGEKWIYLMLTGIVLAILSYFVVRLLVARLDIRSNRILPREVKSIVSALGGEENIERIKGDKLYVKNPNLINILKIDCDIHENEVTMIFDELELLKEYF